MSWYDVLKRTIDMAEYGVEVGDELAFVLDREKETIMQSLPLCNLFCNATRDGVKDSHDVFNNEKLIKLLKNIQVNGSDHFYKFATTI